MVYLVGVGALALLLPLWMSWTQPVDQRVNGSVDSGYTSTIEEVRLTRKSRARLFMLGLSLVAIAAGILALLWVGIVAVYNR